MRVRHITISILSLATCAPIGAAEGVTCKALTGAIEEDLKHAARENALAAGGAQSAETAAARMAVHLAQVQTNTQLLIAHQCPLPSTPLSWRAYQKAAGSCAVETQRARLSGEPMNSSACNIDTWTPSDL